MTEDQVVELLGKLDEPVAPPPEVAEEIWTSLDGLGDIPGDRPQGFQMRTRPGVAALVAFGLVVTLLGATAWLLRGGRSDPATDASLPPVPGVPVQPDFSLRSLGGDAWVLPEGRHPQDLSGDSGRYFALVTDRPYGEGEAPQAEASLIAFTDDGSVLWELRLGGAPTRIMAGGGGVWVIHWGSSEITRVDPLTGLVEGSVRLELPAESDFADEQFVPFDLDIGFGSVWVSTARGAVARVDLETTGTEEVIPLNPGAPGDLMVAETGVWVAEDVAGLTHIEPASNGVFTLPLEVLDQSAEMLSAQGDLIWVAGDRLRRNENGFVVEGGSYLASGDYQLAAVDGTQREVVDHVALNVRPVFLGFIEGRFGVLGEDGVFHAFARGISTHVAGEGSWVVQVGEEAWMIDEEGRVLTRLRLEE